MNAPLGLLSTELKREMAERMQMDTLRISAYDVIAALTAALQAPHSCRRHMETAMAALPRAYTAACQLDPKEDESEL